MTKLISSLFLVVSAHTVLAHDVPPAALVKIIPNEELTTLRQGRDADNSKQVVELFKQRSFSISMWFE